MEPGIFIGGFGFFAVILIVHILIWRIKIPANDAFYLIVIFLVFPIIAAIVAALVKHLQSALPYSYGDIAGVIILHASLSLVYISTYPAVQAVSPSLDILLLIRKSPEGKMSEDAIMEQYRGSRIVTDRVGDLRIYNLIIERDGNFELKPVATLIVLFFIAYRKLLGLPLGEG